MLMYKLFGLLMFLSAIVVFSLNRKHLLLMLLSLEFLVLAVYLNLFIYLSFLFNDFFFSMVYLTFSVCEGALGLSILVSLIRTHGNDYFQSFNVLW
uniref:NADH-ubiquinone oxidoreductase chain 4L n=1 Tax=Anaspis sp. ANA02 TaxID=1205536 RepID=A0A0S2MR34_9CUCU|nr:NADH deshydrogenase subunit 4L [Anaspis sp. ANA02]